MSNLKIKGLVMFCNRLGLSFLAWCAMYLTVSHPMIFLRTGDADLGHDFTYLLA
jgi:hypothetical protein